MSAKNFFWFIVLNTALWGLVSLVYFFTGVADLRKIFDAAKARRETGKGTILFVDEIHRFNRSQQDGFLPYV